MQVNEENVILNVLNAMKYAAEAPDRCHAIFENFEDKLMEEGSNEEQPENEQEEEKITCDYVGSRHELLDLNNRIQLAQKPSTDEAPSVQLKV